MKCVVCDEKALYMLMGNSYCQKHKDKHQKRIDEVIKKAEK